MKTKFLFIVAVLILYSSFAMATIINVPDSCLTIQAAIDSASVGDTVLVQPDTYVENINFNGKNIVVSSLLLLYPDSLSYTDSTIINGNQNGSVVTFANGEDSTAILSGFTITNGSANYGGGIYCYNSSPSLMNLYITNNNSTNYGAGIHCYSSSNLSLYRVAIYENTTLGNGGGISCFDNSNPSLENVTISQNIAYQDGCGIACLFNSSVNIVNTIIWNNGAHEIYVSPSGSISATYSDIKDGTGQSYFGTGCIDANPLFANPNTGNYNLTAISPCIDAGNPNSPLDPDGTIVDMGAFYFQQTASGITGTVTLNGGTGNVEDVEVTADTITVNPNPDGSYIIYIDPGTYDVVASLIGYGPSTQTGVVVDSFLVTPGIDFTLNAISLGTIEGTVTLEGTGNVEDVQVTAGTTTVNPDTNGVYLITVEPGTYDVTASLSPTYQDSTIEDLIVGSGQQVIDQDFYLKLIVFEGIIEGNISLLGGAGNVENVEVTADTVTVNPNASGNYSISIIEGIYDVSASLDGYNSVTIPDVAVVAFDTTRNVDMTLLNWVVIPGTEFSMILYATATLDGQFVDNSASNQLAAFGPGGVS
ncbi:MAG: right-handed parallel beta-helix repeat-containing protein, partial [Candidatus Cloacimonetes bacterium]|nr:right-handed parallel beta-helix repeat-containing protein [Candidatus Cloacimonadota bacterium]